MHCITENLVDKKKYFYDYDKFSFAFKFYSLMFYEIHIYFSNTKTYFYTPIYYTLLFFYTAEMYNIFT